jgi:DNA-binding NtrC family response regulator
MKAGAYDYLTKPFDNDQLLFVVKRAVEHSRMTQELYELRSRFGETMGVDAILGQSAVIRDLRAQILKVAFTDATVLIEGESGTGKELIARALHYESKRREGPLVMLNCAAIPPQLAESELFGHEKGAFTGADESRQGRFELAHGGTLFLDEVAELSPEIQAKLLRVLQDRQFMRVGGTSSLTVDVRIVAATNRDISRELAAGRFREDLYYRLAVVRLRAPSLASHREDIDAYATQILSRAGDGFGRKFEGFSPAALDLLRGHSWPGNFRELENVVRQAAVFAPGPVIEPADLKLSGKSSDASDTGLEQGLEPHITALVRREERKAILEALNAAGWNRTATAERLRISRRTLFEKMRLLALEPEPKLEPENSIPI